MAKRRIKKTRKSRSGLAIPILLTSCLFLLLLGGLFLMHSISQLSDEITEKFTGKRWAVPATIYARPLELYQGLEIDPNMLERELELAAFRKETPVHGSGGYNRQGARFNLVTRDFVYPSGLERSTAVQITFQGRTITAMQAASGQAIPTLRVNPARIGSIHPLVHEDRVILKPDEISPLLRDSLISVEDQDFYSHHGISPTGIARAMLANIRSGKMVQGGSTLTQQLVKNFFLTKERTLKRKVQEAVMAIILETKYSKDEILTAYINEVFLGQDGSRAIHGFGLASQFYFRRDLQELSVAQIATLVGMVKGPSYYDPRRNPERCLARRETVLRLMLDEKAISETAFTQAVAEPLTDVSPPRNSLNRFPAFVDLVKRQLQTEYHEEDLKTEGLQILTTLDPQVQWTMEEQIAKAMPPLQKRKGGAELQLAMLITSRETGEVQAIVGDVNPTAVGFNHAIDARRPIGSLVKPAVYLTALKEGYTLATPIHDSPVSIKSGGKLWQPENYDRRVHGTIALYRALAKSYNLATVNLGMKVGLEQVISTLHDLGYPEQLAPYPSLLLGAPDMTPLQVGQIFQTIASGGFYMPLRSIQGVIAQDGRLLTRYGLEVEQRVDPKPMFLLQHALERVFSEGTASGRHFKGSQLYAGKTGTSNDLRDSWFAGFSDMHMAVVWVGRDDNSPTGLSGSTGALPIWGRVMDAISTRPLEMTEPPGIVWERIDTQTMEPTFAAGEGTTLLPFTEGTEPRRIEPSPQPEPRGNPPTIDRDSIEDKAQKFWDSISNMFN
ncbi:MAG: penicillin-binding protein 1B [Desulfopila sp.]